MRIASGMPSLRNRCTRRAADSLPVLHCPLGLSEALPDAFESFGMTGMCTGPCHATVTPLYFKQNLLEHTLEQQLSELAIMAPSIENVDDENELTTEQREQRDKEAKAKEDEEQASTCTTPTSADRFTKNTLSFAI